MRSGTFAIAAVTILSSFGYAPLAYSASGGMFNTLVRVSYSDASVVRICKSVNPYTSDCSCAPGETAQAISTRDVVGGYLITSYCHDAGTTTSTLATYAGTYHLRAASVSYCMNQARIEVIAPYVLVTQYCRLDGESVGSGLYQCDPIKLTCTNDLTTQSTGNCDSEKITLKSDGTVRLDRPCSPAYSWEIIK